VFEVVLEELPNFGSIFGGGRYDGLVERFQAEPIAAVGASVGVDRLLAALIELGQIDLRRATSEVLVTVMDEARVQDYIELTAELRKAGIAAELWLGKGNLGKQIKFADRIGIPLALIVGSDEFVRGEVSIKDLDLGRRLAEQTESHEKWAEQKQQVTVLRTELVAQIKTMLDASRPRNKRPA
jgi:histidyl-tRNA synthetase